MDVNGVSFLLQEFGKAAGSLLRFVAFPPAPNE